MLAGTMGDRTSVTDRHSAAEGMADCTRDNLAHRSYQARQRCHPLSWTDWTDLCISGVSRTCQRARV